MGLVLLTQSTIALAGTNLVAIGRYAGVPYRRAAGHESFSGGEIVYEFTEPSLNFGRIVVRSRQPLSVVRRDLFVGFSGAGLTIDSRGKGGRSGSVQIDELEIWLRLAGAVRPDRRYEWEIDASAESKVVETGFPAIIPFVWADGVAIGTEVTVRLPTKPDSDRNQRLIIPHGSVEVEDFDRQTGGAWIVLKPQRFGGFFAVRRVSFREAERVEDLEDDTTMPVPIRYVPIGRQLETEVSEALQRGVAALKAARNEENHWPESNPEASVVTTALILSALADVNPDDMSLAPSMQWLAAQQPPDDQPWRTETVAHRITALSHGNGFKRFRRVIRSDIGRLANAQQEDGGWIPGVPPVGAPAGTRRTNHDQSALVIFALRDARFAGAVIDRRLWRNAMQYWTDGRTFDGGYRDAQEGLGSVGRSPDSAHTALGAASMMASLDLAACFGGRRCSSYLASGVQLDAITNALGWLDRHYGQVVVDLVPPTAPPDPYDEPLAMQRLRCVLGITHLGGKDHFVESARKLLAHYDKETGMFGLRNSATSWAQAPSLVRTARALSILAAGSAPTICQRMVVGDDADGHSVHGPDASHLARFVGTAWGRLLNWRRTSIDRDVRELAEVPLLVLSVVGPIDWSDEQWGKIRDYCFAGGTVVVDLPDGQKALRKSLISGLRRAFPEFELTDLPTDSPIVTGPRRIASPPTVATLGNGFRTFLFLPKDSWSCHWQLFDLRKHLDSFHLVDNLLQNATDLSAKSSSFAESTYPIGSVPSYFMSATRIEVGGQRVVYPDLHETIDRLMRDGFRIAVNQASSPATADLLWVSVVGDAEPAMDQMQHIQQALSGGAYLLVDVVSGNEDWDEDFRARLTRLDDVTLTKLHRTDPIFTGDIPGSRGFSSITVGLRAALRDRFANSGRCDLYEIRQGEQTVGVYSAYDLASGVGYQYFAGCRGPSPAAARGLVMNAFLMAYAEKRSR